MIPRAEFPYGLLRGKSFFNSNVLGHIVLGLTCFFFLPGNLPAQEVLDTQDPGQEEKVSNPVKKPFSLLEIVRLESEREKKERDTIIQETLLQLGIYTDPDLAFAKRKREEILSHGYYAVPHLVQAMKSTSTERTRINAGRIAATLLAEIHDPRIEKEVMRLLDSENGRTRANAILCIGKMGLKKYIGKIKPNLDSQDPDLLCETIICLGRLKSEDTLELTKPFFSHPDSKMRIAGIQALALWGKGGTEACAMVVNSLGGSQEKRVREEALNFLQAFGDEACVPFLIEKYSLSPMRRKERYSVLSTLTAIGIRMPLESRKEIINFLKSLLEKEDYETVKKAANYLHDLGNDSGVEILTSSMDKLIDKHGNAEYYYRRGEIYLQFKKYKEAKRDFLEGIRKDKRLERTGKQKVFIALARCYAAEDRFLEAERNLRKAKLEDTTSLPIEYEEFRKMAQDDRYAKVFQPGWK